MSGYNMCKIELLIYDILKTISKLQKNKKNSKAKTCINYSFKEINYSCFLNVGTDPRLW